MTDPNATVGRTLSGRCATGAERGRGKLVHAVKGTAYPWYRPAMCGAKPGRLSAGWSEQVNEPVTCSKCLQLIAPATDLVEVNVMKQTKLNPVETEINRLSRLVRKYIRSGDSIIAGEVARLLAHKVAGRF